MDENQPEPESLSEEKRLRRLRTLVDVTAVLLRQADLTLDEALLLMQKTREHALELFPCRSLTYDMIYTSRFSRILEERFGAKWQNHPRRLSIMARLTGGD